MNHLSQSGSSRGASGGVENFAGQPELAARETTHASDNAWANGIHLESLANLAHELRTPVQVLFGYLDILRADWPDGTLMGVAGAPARDIIDRMNANVHELAQTVENVVEYALASSTRGAVIEEEINVPQFFAEVEEIAGASMRNPSVALRVDLARAPRIVHMRRRPLRSIVLNLANNAVKFTTAGEVAIIVSASDAQPELRIEIRDTGQGISSDMLSAAFEPLVQLSNSSIRRHRGLGLGLTLVQHNVKLLGGRLQVESEPGVGSCFRVSIPCSDSAS